MLIAFRSGPGSKCLDDPPHITLPSFTNKNLVGKLPGVLFDRDTQCKFQYGDQYGNCVHQPYKVRLLQINLLVSGE